MKDSPCPAEMETELSLPVRLRYVRDAEGALEIVALLPAPGVVDAEGRVAFAALPEPEQRALETLARAHAARQAAEARLDRQLSARASAAFWLTGAP